MQGQQDKPVADAERRQLIKKLGLGVATGAVGLAVSSMVSAQDKGTQPSATKEATGYLETQHIRDYYNTL